MRRMLRKAVPVACMALACQATLAETEEEAQQRRILLEPCTGCHGPSGASTAPEVPHLDRQLALYLEESIELLSKKKRASNVADHIPISWTPREMKIAATFYSTATASRDKETIDPDKAALGKEVFLDRCQHCHENGGNEPDSKGLGSAILAGQRLGYLERQIADYVLRKRKFLTAMKERAFSGAPLVVNGNQISEKREGISESDAGSLAHFLASNRSEAEPKRRGRKK